MTRKEALQEVLKTQTNPEIIEKLQDIIDDEPSVKWTKKKILDSIEQFIIDNNRCPLVCEMDRSAILPAHSNISYYFNMTYKELIKEYFSDYARNNKAKTDINTLGKQFKKEFVRLEYPSESIYNIKRSKELPTIQTTAKYMGAKNFTELLKMCGFYETYLVYKERRHSELYKNSPTIHKRNFTGAVYRNKNLTLDESENILSELRKYIS